MQETISKLPPGGQVLTELGQTARTIERLRKQLEMALLKRDVSVVAALDAGASQAEIARVMRTSPGRVAQIVAKVAKS